MVTLSDNDLIKDSLLQKQAQDQAFTCLVRAFAERGFVCLFHGAMQGFAYTARGSFHARSARSGSFCSFRGHSARSTF